MLHLFNLTTAMLFVMVFSNYIHTYYIDTSHFPRKGWKGRNGPLHRGSQNHRNIYRRDQYNYFK